MVSTEQLQKNVKLLVLFYFGLKHVSIRGLCGKHGEQVRGLVTDTNAAYGPLTLRSLHVYIGLSEYFQCTQLCMQMWKRKMGLFVPSLYFRDSLSQESFS